MEASASTSSVQQEEDEFDEVFKFHCHCIDAIFKGLSSCKDPKNIKFQFSETNCGSEADERNAWGFFYVGSVKERVYFSLYSQEVGIIKKIDPKIEWNELHTEDAMEIIGLYGQSLAQGKSSMLRYLASWRLGKFYDSRMERLQAIPYYRIQLEEAEALTGWKHAKVCALYNLCKDLCACGEFEEAIRIERELEMMGRDDRFTMGISLHCHGHIAWVMSNFEECIEANNSAIHILSDVRQNCTPQMRGIMLELLPSSMDLANFQIERANRRVGISGIVGVGGFGKEAEGAKMLSLIAILKEEDDKFYQGILCHQYAIARRDKELVEAATSNVLAGWHKGNPPIMDEQKSEIVERITRYLTDTCRVEAEESRAWAFFYVGELLKGNKETFQQSIDMFKQSLLHEKSSILKYMASSRLAACCIEDAEVIKYLKIQLEAAEATTWKGSNSKVYALFQICWYLCRNSQFEEAKKFLEQLSEVKSDDRFLLKVAEGLSSQCEGVIADSIGDTENSVQACRHAIAILGGINFTEIRDDIVSVIHAPTTIAQLFATRVIADARAREEFAKARSQLLLLDLRECEDWQLRMSSFILTMKDDLEEEMRNGMLEGHMYNRFLFMGLMYLMARDFDEAEAVACKLLEISQRFNHTGLHARSLIFAAEVAGFCCPMNVDVIESFCVEAQKLVPEDPRSVNLHNMAYTEACLYLGMNKLKEAKEKFQVCIHRLMDIEKNLSRSEWRISYLNQMKACFWSMQRTLFVTAMRNEHGGPLKISYSHLKSESTVLNGNEVKDALIWAERERARDLLNVIQKKSQDHHAYLNDLSVFDRDDIQAWIELKDVCSLVGQDTLFLVFTARDLFLKTYFLHPGKERVSAICSKLSRHPYLLALDTLNRDTTTWIAYMCYLFNICIRPFKQRLEDGEIKKIIIVPNGEMSLVPFATLRDDEDEDQPYLIQKYEISVISSLRMFKYCERRREHLMTKIGKDRSALVVGNPTGDLLLAREEAGTVAGILRDSGMDIKLLMEEQATTQVVSDSLSKSFWIHMACHATIGDDMPDGALKLARNVALDIGCENAALVLASNESYNDCRNIESIATKGFLTAEDIANGSEIRAVATVLSACSSGRGRVCAEGTLGLTRSLHLAGVPTVVASTWDVDDNATSEFMKRFYTNISDGCQVATALRKTMVSMIDKYEPRHWAPFFISGSPSLRLPRIHIEV